jgi:hypothetical protein
MRPLFPITSIPALSESDSAIRRRRERGSDHPDANELVANAPEQHHDRNEHCEQRNDDCQLDQYNHLAFSCQCAYHRARIVSLHSVHV